LGKFSKSAAFVRIGSLARVCGLSPDTLRHYERLKLLRPSARTPAGYRLYGADAAARVRLVQAALSVGFTLKELSRLMADRDAGRAPCRSARELAAKKLGDLEEKLGEMVRLRASLRELLAKWDSRLERTPAGSRAHLLDALGSGELHLDLPRRTPIVATIKRRKTP
jgi:MerR family transcriptional regulator, Zn(II)-responsive regulator of zntA